MIGLFFTELLLSIVSLCRNGVRMIHIPFGDVNVNMSQDRSQLEEELRQACEDASCSVGIMISMGGVLKSDDFNKRFHDYFIPLVRQHLTGMPYRVHKSYALLMGIAEEVSDVYKMIII